jgi:hypothetical protein
MNGELIPHPWGDEDTAQIAVEISFKDQGQRIWAQFKTSCSYRITLSLRANRGSGGEVINRKPEEATDLGYGV